MIRFLIFLALAFEVMNAAQPLPTNFSITPSAAKGSTFSALNPGLVHRPDFLAGQASATALSPDGKTLLVMTSGYNRMNHPDGTRDANASNEYVFVYDISHGKARQKQVLQVANTFYGLAWHPSGEAFYLSGGVDDLIYRVERREGRWQQRVAVKLNHKAGLGIEIKPMAAEVALSESGRLMAVTNMENDSVTLIATKNHGIMDEIDLRPGKTNPALKGVAGGEFPFGVAFAGEEKLYVASMRDNEVIVLQIRNKQLRIINRIHVGSQPTRMLVSGTELYVANSRSDTISVIDTRSDHVIGVISSTAPDYLFPNSLNLKGANPNAMVLSTDKKRLYVTNGGINAVAVIELSRKSGKIGGEVVGLIPTGWYPNDLSLSGGMLYVANGKSVSGPNSGDCRDNLSTASDSKDACKGRNLYVWQTKKAGFLQLPLPDDAELKRLTQIVAENNRFIQNSENMKSRNVMAFLRSHIDHVIYVVKENRSYDQVLGDLEVGNGDKSLNLFPEPLSPNHHKLAREFVTLDNFLDSGSSSNDGWVWTTAGHTTEYSEKNIAIHYAGRGLSYDNEGQNRNINLGLADPLERSKEDSRIPADADLLPGIADVAAPDGPHGEAGKGYIWDAAMRAGLNVRNYGFYCDEERYYLPEDHPSFVRLSAEPFKEKVVQAYANKPALRNVTDPYFRGYDMKYPDHWRYKEWEREFDAYAKAGELPNLMLVRFPHDHFGAFSDAVAGVNTPETQMADNDYAVGLLVEKIAKSPFAQNTLIFIIEDDAQDGADHVDAHRSIAYVVGPYVKQRAVVNTRYTTVSMLRTIEDILALQPLGLNDGLAEPMSEVFDIKQAQWSYRAAVPDVLYTTELKLPPREAAKTVVTPRHEAAYWEKAMEGQNFDTEDNLDTDAFNRALWKGLKGDVAFPAAPSQPSES